MTPSSNSIELIKIEFTMADLESLGQHKATFLVQAGSLLQEIIALQKYVYMATNTSSERMEQVAGNAQSLYFLRLLAGTLFEGWELIFVRHSKYKPITAEYRIKFDEQARNSLTKLEDYFSERDNTCARIRNRFSHHNDMGVIRQIMNRWPKEDKLEIFLSEMHANCRYIASDNIIHLALVDTTDAGEIASETKQVTFEVGEVARMFADVLGELLANIASEMVETRGLSQESFTLENVPKLSEIPLPYFVRNP